MAVLIWDKTGEKYYETGVKKGVLYPMEGATYGNGVAWNGLTQVSESPSGAEATKLYADDIKYLDIRSAEEFGATIEAYQSPEEFDICDGTAELATGVTIGQQNRVGFGFSYVSTIGNDTKFNDFGYKIHIIYGLTASPSERSYSSINDSPEAQTLSWEVSSTPINVEGFKPTSVITINSTKCPAEALKEIEETLYGSATKEPKILLPDEIKAIIDKYATQSDLNDGE